MAKKKKEPKTKPFKFGEETVTVFGVRVPESKEEEYREWHGEKIKPLVEKKLKTYKEVKKDEK